MKRFLLFIALIAFAGTLNAQQHGSYYLSPYGSDTNSGASENAPFQTFEKALEVVAELPRPWSSDVVVNVMAGDYFLESTIQLSAEHSGDGDHKLVFRNHGVLASPVLIGGQKLDPGSWNHYQDGIYYQDLLDQDRIDIIYENRRKARKARFPNHEYLPDFPTTDGEYFISGQVGITGAYITAQSQDLNADQLTALNEDLNNQDEVYLVVWGHGQADWHKWVYPITHTVPALGRIYVSEQNPTFHQGGKTDSNRYYIEGGLRYLDAPGEFYFDATQHRLYYKPAGSTADEIIYSTMHNILAVDGASNITFEGLQFACSGVLPFTDSSYTWNDPEAAVAIKNSTSIEIRSCHFKSTGQSAINLESSHQNVIENCLLQYLGQSGIKLYKSDDNTIQNCLIHNIGLRRVYCEGVAIHLSEDNLVSHLKIYNSARYGVTVRGRVDPDTGNDGRPTRNNTVEYVKMHDVNQDSGDTAGLHMARINAEVGQEFINYFDQITISRSIAQPNITDEWKPTGVYLDHSKQVMNQSMRNIEVRDYDPRYPGYVASRFDNLYGDTDRTSDKQRQIMQHRVWNNDSSTKFNCSWQESFDSSHMEYAMIGLTDDFPEEYSSSAITNEVPVFIKNALVGKYALLNEAYSGTIAGAAIDPNGDALTYSKVTGPAWLTVVADGTLHGTPFSGDLGAATCIINVSDGIQAAVEIPLKIEVFNAPPTIAYWNARGADISTVPDLAGGDHSLFGAFGMGASGVTVSPNPVPNPDIVTTGAAGSILFSTKSSAPATSNASAFKLTSSRSFIFEGWLLHDVSNGSQSGIEYIGGDRHGTTGYNGWHLVVANGNVQIFAQGTTITSTTRIDDGVAHHFAAVWDHYSNGGEFRLYVDGVLEGSDGATPVSYTQTHFTIGGRTTGTNGIYDDNIFQGRLDEMRFGGAAFDPSQFLSAPESNYSQWIDGFGLDAEESGFQDDPDGDGLPNGIEAFFGTNPRVANSGLTEVGVSEKMMSFQHPNPYTPLNAVNGNYQWSLDLITWYAADGQDGDGNTILTAEAIVNSPDANTTTVTYSMNGFVPDTAFFRPQASAP